MTVEERPVAPDVPRPAPLPVPPRTGLMSDRRARAGLIVGAVLVVVVTLISCGLALSGLDDLIAEILAGPDRGVLQMTWAGDGRYAIVEYVGTGLDATTSVIAWDSVTRRTVRADGFRLVAVEASATQVWLARAPLRETGLGAEEPLDESDADEYDYSPWNDPAMVGVPPSDGPGVPWVWDVSSGGSPVRPSEPHWRPWAGPAGITATLKVTPDTGLWPSSVEFATEGTATRLWQAEGSLTFLPLGWSPSGRYFAIWRAADSGNGEVTIIDATTGGTVARDVDASDATESAERPSASFDGIAGAAWDPETDALWIIRYDTTDDGGTYRVRASTLVPGGEPVEAGGAPAGWRSAMDQPTLLGTDSQGVLIAVEIGSGTGLWRARGGRIAKAGEFAAESASLAGAGTYSAKGRLLVYAQRDGDVSFGTRDAAAAVSDLTGRNVTAFWPPDWEDR